jgi:methionyl-tRNA formyltransferase
MKLKKMSNSMKQSNVKIVVFLNGNRGLGLIQRLTTNGIKIYGVVFHGEKIDSKILKSSGLENVPMIDITKKNWPQLANFLTTIAPDICIVAGFSMLIPADILDKAKFGFWNLHAGKVPGYRGGSPLNWQLINGEKVCGVSILQMVEELDAGPVLAESQFKIEELDTISELHTKAESEFYNLIERLLVDPLKSKKNAKKQPQFGFRYWHQRSDEDGWLNPQIMDSVSAHRFIRALTRPYPGAWVLIKGKKLRIFEAKNLKNTYKGTPGKILKLSKKNPIMIFSSGSLELIEYYFEGSKDKISKNLFVDRF